MQLLSCSKKLGILQILLFLLWFNIHILLPKPSLMRSNAFLISHSWLSFFSWEVLLNAFSGQLVKQRFVLTLSEGSMIWCLLQAEVLGVDPREVNVPVVGGHSQVTIFPLLSQVGERTYSKHWCISHAVSGLFCVLIKYRI